MILGRLHIRLARSLWSDGRPHGINGFSREPLLIHFIGDTLVYGRGGVLAIGVWMLWYQWETHRREMIR